MYLCNITDAYRVPLCKNYSRRRTQVAHKLLSLSGNCHFNRVYVTHIIQVRVIKCRNSDTWILHAVNVGELVKLNDTHIFLLYSSSLYSVYNNSRTLTWYTFLVLSVPKRKKILLLNVMFWTVQYEFCISYNRSAACTNSVFVLFARALSRFNDAVWYIQVYFIVF